MDHFKSDKTADELASSYRSAMHETIEDLLKKIKYLEEQIDIRDEVIKELKLKNII
jgi:uncharacterized protein Yka (UPF0111/DUF47 family)